MRLLFVAENVDFIDPIGMMLISAIARARGHETMLAVDSREDVLEVIEAWKPRVVAYSATTGEAKYYFALNERIKARFPAVITIMGGAHTTFYPECVEETTLDAVFVGEAEEAFAEFLDAVEAGRDYSDIVNVRTKGKDTGFRMLLQDIDGLPFPDRELYYSRTEMKDFPLKSFMTSRGCPYPCTYCFNHAFRRMYQGKGKIIRKHSVDYVLEEVRRVQDTYRLECVKFYDDIFIYKVDDWLEEFVRRYPQEIGLPFHCLLRANLVTEDMARMLKEAGLFSVSMSIEAGNEHFRNDVLKRGMSTKEITDAFDTFYGLGVHTFSNNILGLPHATIENDIETLDLNLRCRVTFAEFPIFHPYPGTELGNYCIDEHLFDSEFEALHMSYQNKSPLNSFTEEEKDIQKNLSELGLLVIWFPWMRNLVVNRMIKWKPNRFFFLCYYVAKSWLVKTKIYPFHMRLSDIWGMFNKSLRLEQFKHHDERFKKG